MDASVEEANSSSALASRLLAITRDKFHIPATETLGDEASVAQSHCGSLAPTGGYSPANLGIVLIMASPFSPWSLLVAALVSASGRKNPASAPTEQHSAPRPRRSSL